MNPKVTVLMSVYNGEKFLQESIKSILEQTFKDFEFLIIDDGSSDGSKEIVQSFNAPRIILIENEKNIGLAQSLNKGLKLAKGQYIARMDADDISLPDRLEKQVSFMDNNPEIDVCGSWIKLFDNKKSSIRKYPEKDLEIKAHLFFNSYIAHPTVILRKCSFQKYNLFYSSDFKAAQDFDLWTRAAKNCNFTNLPEVLLLHRKHKVQTSKASNENQKKYANEVRIRQLKNLLGEINQQEIDLHLSILSKAFNTKNTHITQIKDWLERMDRQNKKSRKYDINAFSQLLAEYWLISCQNYAKSGIMTWKIYWNCKLSNYKSKNMFNYYKFILYIILGKLLFKYKKPIE